MAGIARIGRRDWLRHRPLVARDGSDIATPRDAVLTDVSPDMLRICRTHLTRLGLASALPVRFATYSAHEACFCDEAFDSCIGTSVVHHITDVRAFLTDVWRILKARRPRLLHRAEFSLHPCSWRWRSPTSLRSCCHEIPTYSADRQTLHNWVAEARRGTMLQGDLALLEGFRRQTYVHR